MPRCGGGENICTFFILVIFVVLLGGEMEGRGAKVRGRRGENICTFFIFVIFVVVLLGGEVEGRGAKVWGRRGVLGGRGEEAQRAWRGGRMSLRTTQ